MVGSNCISPSFACKYQIGNSGSRLKKIGGSVHGVVVSAVYFGSESRWFVAWCRPSCCSLLHIVFIRRGV